MSRRRLRLCEIHLLIDKAAERTARYLAYLSPMECSIEGNSFIGRLFTEYMAIAPQKTMRSSPYSLVKAIVKLSDGKQNVSPNCARLRNSTWRVYRHRRSSFDIEFSPEGFGWYAFTAPSFHVSAEAISDFDRALPYAMSVLSDIDRQIAVVRMIDKIRTNSESACKSI